jgi:hypothetical protein
MAGWAKTFREPGTVLYSRAPIHTQRQTTFKASPDFIGEICIADLAGAGVNGKTVVSG